jgi:uncharacterized membrane protein YfcA
MTPEAQTLLVLCVIFVSTMIRSAFGFGDAVVAMPLLVLLVGIRTATPLVALVAFLIAFSILLRDWRSVRLKSAMRLILSSLLGIPFGLFFLKGVHEEILKGVLGVVILAFALFRLSTLPKPVIKTDRTAWLFGFLAGVLGGAYNTNGPPVVVYASLKQWPPASFRATLQGYFLFTGIFILAGHFSAGLWSPSVLRFFLYALPVVIIAVLLGERLGRSLPNRRFDRGVYGLLIALSVFLLADVLRKMCLPP